VEKLRKPLKKKTGAFTVENAKNSGSVKASFFLRPESAIAGGRRSDFLNFQAFLFVSMG